MSVQTPFFLLVWYPQSLPSPGSTSPPVALRSTAVLCFLLRTPVSLVCRTTLCCLATQGVGFQFHVYSFFSFLSLSFFNWSLPTAPESTGAVWCLFCFGSSFWDLSAFRFECGPIHSIAYPFAVDAAQGIAFRALVPDIRRLCPNMCLY